MLVSRHELIVHVSCWARPELKRQDLGVGRHCRKGFGEQATSSNPLLWGLWKFSFPPLLLHGVRRPICQANCTRYDAQIRRAFVRGGDDGTPAGGWTQGPGPSVVVPQRRILCAREGSGVSDGPHTMESSAPAPPSVGFGDGFDNACSYNGFVGPLPQWIPRRRRSALAHPNVMA